MAALLRHELASCIQRDFPVSVYGLITVSAVVLSSDLSNANVFVSCFRGMEEKSLIDTLSAHSGQFRHAISQVVHARSVPKLRFVYDTSIARTARVEALLSKSRYSGHAGSE